MSSLIIAVMLLSGCGAGASSRSAHTGPTPDAGATQTVQAEQRGPVTVQVSAQVQGSVAARTLMLIAQVTVINHTEQPIYLAGTCPQPAISLTLTPQGKTTPVTRITDIGLDCMLPDVNHAYSDLGPAIASGGSHAWTLTVALCQFDTCLGQAGTYVLTAVVPAWHQGTIEQFNTNVPVLHGSAQGQTVITLV